MLFLLMSLNPSSTSNVEKKVQSTKSRWNKTQKAEDNYLFRRQFTTLPAPAPETQEADVGEESHENQDDPNTAQFTALCQLY